MPFDLWLLFVAVSLLPAISPGPAIMLAISNTLRFGRNAALASATGNTVGLIILGYAVALGFGAVMATSAFAFTILKVIGAAYLMFLGIKIWRDKNSFQVHDSAPLIRKHPFKLFLEALFIALTNPKAILVISALFPQFMHKGRFDWMEVTVLSLTYAALCYANHIAIAFAGNQMRRFLTSAKRVFWVRRITGGLFVGFGAALASASR